MILVTNAGGIGHNPREHAKLVAVANVLLDGGPTCRTGGAEEWLNSIPIP